MGDATQDLFQMWKQATEQGVEAWSRALRQTQQPDIYQFWRPFFDQQFQALTQMMNRGAGPDVLSQWKQGLDQAIQAWSKALEQAMATEQFATALGKYLDQYLAAVGPAKQAMEQQGEALLKALGLASRSQVTEMAGHLGWLETRLEQLEAKIERVLSLATSIEEALKRTPSA